MRLILKYLTAASVSFASYCPPFDIDSGDGQAGAGGAPNRRSSPEAQEEALTELRARTGTLLTAASLIASFLGGQALAREGLSVWIVLALLAFGVSVVLCIYVLLPKDGLIFALDAPKTYSALYEVRDDEKEVDRRLAYWLQAFREGNHSTVGRLTDAFELAGLALLAEIAFLAVGLAVS